MKNTHAVLKTDFTGYFKTIYPDKRVLISVRTGRI